MRGMNSYYLFMCYFRNEQLSVLLSWTLLVFLEHIKQSFPLLVQISAITLI